jgi:chemotaxis methyl-accepting protein methylase/chemotaxis response regulator CheB/signal transduction histidine kinase
MAIPVVGIGASAGGLEAFRVLLAHLPVNTGLAFVFVQHLDPKHHSNLTEILAKVSAIPVQQATDGLEIEPNHLYVIPADAALEIANQTLRVTPRAPTFSGPHMPVDHFLLSLAHECGNRAIGVLLSGAGTDGAAGLEAVKEAGGVTFAQDPTTAKFDSMPHAAIERGCVDFVLSPEAIAAELTKLGQHSYMADDEKAGLLESADVKDQFDPILTLLRNATGIDFTLYREKTVRRRILRRLALRGPGSLEIYRAQLENDPSELSALHRDLLMSVTHFFRDPESFESLKNLVFPRLVQHRPEGAAIRVWVPDCATGEEAYSIAIALQEYFEETGHVYQVRIFASDVSPTAVEKARHGKYGETIAEDVGPERLKRYFSNVEGGYQISKALREMCVFSRHDLIQDPPFSKLDLISCRNVLIFFGGVRRNVISLFHYSLKPDGFLMLGPSEAPASNLFSKVEGAQSIYTKNETVSNRRPSYAGAVATHRNADAYQRMSGTPAGELGKGIDRRRELERAPLSRYNGSGVVVDETLEVLETLGHIAPYLTLPAGRVSLNLLKLIPETGLFLEVEKLVRDVERSGERGRKNRIPYQAAGAAGEVNVEVIPLGGTPPRALLVLFESASGAPDIERASNVDPKDREIASLKRDLADARQRLLSMIEERQSSAEDNQNAAEEAISANEELQSLNEELETAKEELQSTNEELTTVIDELRSNNAALTEARDFALSIRASVVARDITELKRRQQESFARQKLEIVGTLAGGIAHDFNNILGGIVAHTELALAELASSSSPAEELERIRVGGIRGAEIVQQLMIYAGQEREVLEPVDVSQVVQDMLELLKLSVSKHAVVETDFGKDLPPVRASPGQLRQLVMNLITNASEAMGDRDGVIRVTTRRVTMGEDSSVTPAGDLAKGDYVQLQVSDTGRGMAAETQAQVFDPFFTTKHEGHGLGLAVVQGIVRSLGGEIRIVSALGQGSTFQILLPCTERTAQPARRTISREPRKEFPSRNATVLVVEDEDLLRQGVSKMLQKMGSSVIEAMDGSAALNLIRAHKDHIDILLLDITLPGASSREVFEEAKRLRPGMKVIATSAYSEEMAAATLAGKADRFLRKPYRLSDLADSIRELLSS